jgi:hypothetical protein|tara:strand:+ start:6678 stop:6893 length:216 start_codon:yes stop_codon:yes gene_type:complete
MSKEIEVTLHLDGDPVAKERDFYRARMVEMTKRIKSLEYDNAELIKRDGQLSVKLKEVSSRVPYRNNRRRA